MSDGEVHINSDSDTDEEKKPRREKLAFHLMALEALRMLKGRNGSTTGEIEKYVQAEFEFKSSIKGWLVNALKKLADEGLVAKVNGHTWKLVKRTRSRPPMMMWKRIKAKKESKHQKSTAKKLK